MISSTIRKVGPFSGTGLVSTFPFSFKVFASTDLKAVSVDSGGFETALVLNSDFTATLNADQDNNPGGSITLSAPLATGYQLIITTAVAETQTVQLTDLGGFYPAVLNALHDKVVILTQQQQEQIDRCVKFPTTDSTSPNLDGPLRRAGALLGFDSTGKPSLLTAVPAGVGSYARTDAPNTFSSTQTFSAISVPSIDGVILASACAGADAGQQIAAAIALLPSAGGIVDARGFHGPQVIASPLNFSKGNVRLLLGSAVFKVTAQITVSAANVSITGIGQQSEFDFWGVAGPQVSAAGFTIENVALYSYSAVGVANPDAYFGIDVQGTSGAHIFYNRIRDVNMLGWNTAVKWAYTWQSKIENLQTGSGSNGVEVFGQSVNNDIQGDFVSNGAAGSASIKLTKDVAIRGEGLMIHDSLLYGAQYGVYAPGGGAFLSVTISNSTIDMVGTNGIYSQGVDGLLVTNSWIYSVGIGIFEDALGSPADLHTSITGNQIISTSTHGVRINGNVQGVSVVGNTIKYATNGYGVYFEVASSANKAISNHLVNTGGGLGGFFNASDGATIALNDGDSSLVTNVNAKRYTAFGNSADAGAIISATAVPTVGTWKHGDFVVNASVAASGIAGWICSVAGTPGTWVAIPAASDATAGWKAVMAPTSLTVGSAGTAVTKLAKYTATLSPASVAANTTAVQALAVTGIAAGDVVVGVSKPTAQAGLGIVGWYNNGTNSIGIVFSNNTASPITPTAAEVYTFVVIQ